MHQCMAYISYLKMSNILKQYLNQYRQANHITKVMDITAMYTFIEYYSFAIETVLICSCALTFGFVHI
jgi:hypothetical protein